jgi:Domain of unknown function (DUF4440)
MCGRLRRVGIGGMKAPPLLFLFAMLLPASMSIRAPGETLLMNSSTASTAVTDTIRAMFIAAGSDDIEKFQSLIAPGFYAFDNGKRFDGDALMRTAMSAHAKGMKFVWNVTESDVRIYGDHAWIAYKNVGSIQVTADAAPTPMTWLESAYLERHNASWKILFLHSSREAASHPIDSR